MLKEEGYIWAEENKHLYEDLEAGTLYRIFEDEPPVLASESKVYYKSKKGVSKNGNVYICKIGVCEDCGRLIAASRLRACLCDDCQSDRHAEQIRNYYYNHRTLKEKKPPKPKPKKSLTAIQIARKITGIYIPKKRDEVYPDVYDEVEAMENKIYQGV